MLRLWIYSIWIKATDLSNIIPRSMPNTFKVFRSIHMHCECIGCVITMLLLLLLFAMLLKTYLKFCLPPVH